MKSEQINELATALSKAQAEMSNPVVDSVNPHFRNKYVSLAAVRNAVIPVMAKHGLSVVQSLTCGEKSVRCSTLIMHSSGQWWESEQLEIPVTKVDPQGFGSACTYARRYTLMAVAGVSGDEDDDANVASKATVANVPVERITKEQYRALSEACARANVAVDNKDLLAWLCVEKLETLPSARYSMAMEGLAKKAADKEKHAGNS